MKKVNGIILPLIVASLLVGGGIFLYHDYIHKNDPYYNERLYDKEDEAKNKKNSLDQSSKEEPKSEVTEEGNAMGGSQYALRQREKEAQEKRCECLNCNNEFSEGKGIPDYCGSGYYVTSGSGEKHKIVGFDKSGCLDFCSRRCYDEYHSHVHNGHDYGSTTKELPGN